jgi:superfamily II DNA or RNA helicase
MSAKTATLLASQLNAFLAHTETVSTLPPVDTTFDELVVLPIETLKERFPVQFRSYLEFLRALRKELPQDDGNEEHVTLGARAAEKLGQLADGTLKPSLRPHQMEALTDLVSFLDSGEASGWVRLPTGAGKTAVFVTLTALLDVPTIIVVPKKDLVRQTMKEWEKFGGDPRQIGAFYSDKKVCGARTIITTYASLPSLLEQLPPGAQFPVVVCDEAHRSLSSRSFEAINRIPGNRIRIGFTATPDFTAVKSVRRSFGTLIHEMHLVDAIRSGICSGVRVVYVKTTSKVVGAETGASGDFNQKQLAENLDSAARNRAALAILSAPEMQSRSVVVSCLSLKQARALSEAARELGLKAGYVHGGMSKTERETAYRAFEAGDVKILFAVDLLTEGWDSPRADTLLNLRPTASRVVAEQRGGRVLRLHPDKEGALVIEFVDHIRGRGRTRAITMVDVLNCSVVMPTEDEESRTADAACDWIRNTVRDHATIADFDVGITEEEILKIAVDQGMQRAENIELLKGANLSPEQEAALRNHARQELSRSGFPNKLGSPDLSSGASAASIKLANGKRLGSFLTQYARSIGKPFKTGPSKRPSLRQMHAMLLDIIGSEYDRSFKPAFSKDNPTGEIAMQLLFQPVHDMLEQPVSAPAFAPQSARVFTLESYLPTDVCEEARSSASQLIHALASTFKDTPLCARLFVDAHRTIYGDASLLAQIACLGGIDSMSAHEFAGKHICPPFPKVEIPGWAILASFGITSEEMFEDFLTASGAARQHTADGILAPREDSFLPLRDHIVQVASSAPIDKELLNKIPASDRQMHVRLKQHAQELRKWMQSLRDASQPPMSHAAFLSMPVPDAIQALGFPFQRLRALVVAWDQATATVEGRRARPHLLQSPLSQQGSRLLVDFIQFIKQHARTSSTPSRQADATESRG